MKPFRAAIPALAVLALAAGSFPLPLRAQNPALPRVTETEFLFEGEEIPYGISVPASYDGSPGDPRPLVLALHPGGQSYYYGSWFMQAVVEPALREWDAIIVAPDAPGNGWANELSERAVLALMEDVIRRYAVDPTQVLVTGFSSGGRGVWYLATRNPERFAGAIAMAARPGDENLDALRSLPLYLIHSPDDEVVPYEPVAETALRMADLGHAVRLLSVPGLGHYMMAGYVGPLREGGRWIKERWRETGTGTPER